MKKTIFLHVGIHKTGTTSIQYFFSSHYKSLLEKGILYPKRIRNKGKDKYSQAHHLLANAFLPAKIKGKEELLERFISKFEIELEKKQPDSIFISSETFSFFRKKGFSYFKKRFKNFTIIPIVYLRRQDEYIESYYKQRIKSGYTKTFTEFCNEKKVDYLSLLQSLETIFGKENLIIKLFNDVEVRENLLGDLLSTIGYNFNTKLFNISQNKSIPNEDLELLRNMNQITNARIHKILVKYFKNQDSLIKSIGTELQKSTFHTAKSLEKTYKRATKENAIIKAKYFPERKGDLFKWDLENQLTTLNTFKPKKYSDEEIWKGIKKIKSFYNR